MDQIRATYHLLAHQSPVEIRVIQPLNDESSQVLADFMTPTETEFVSACQQWDGKGNIYVGSRERRLGFAPQNNQGAKKRDITAITVIPVDIDPVRPNGLKKQAATEAELQYALDAAQYLRTYFFPARGFVSPVRAMSGNGVQLWACIPRYELPESGWYALGKSEHHRIEDAIKFFFTEIQQALPPELQDKVSIDAIHDLTRLIKVIGTMSVKGDPTKYPDRPHRRSYFIDEPVRIEDAALLDYLLDLQSQQAKQRKQAKPRNGKQSTSSTSDADVLHRLMKSANGQKFCQLYAGDWSGYESESEADCALLARLLWGTQHDEGQALRIFEASPYFGKKDDAHQQKWERQDYQQRTTAKALEGLGMYDPNYQSNTQSGHNGNHASAQHDSDKSKELASMEAILSEIGCLDSKEPASIQALLWGKVPDASHWSATDLGRFRDTLNTEHKLTKTWIKDWAKAVEVEKRKRRAKLKSTQQASSNGALPTIVTTDRHMREVTADALHAIDSANNGTPFVFIRSGMPTRVDIDENNNAIARPLTVSAMRGIFERTADFVSETDVEGEQVQKPINPPLDYVNDLLSLGSFNGLPKLTGISTAPLVASDGTICTSAGYQPKTGYYYHADENLTIGDTTPTPENVEEAKQLILDELLVDFPFDSQASRANTIALMLNPFVRPLIDGATPLHAIDANTPGAGKTMLAEIAALLFVPNGPTIMTSAARDEAEWRKRITAKLSTGASHILIDNVKDQLQSGSLAAALTVKNEWEDRLLSTSTTIRLPVRCTWIATGNNLGLSDEIGRRTVWIRIESPEERPWELEPTDFKHPELMDWVKKHRGELITALLTFVEKWLADGRPKSDHTLGSYEAWSHVVGGILKAVGIDGFMENADDLYDQLDTAREAWVDFFSAWAEKYGAYDPVTESWGMRVTSEDGSEVWERRDPMEVISSVGVKELFPLASTPDDKEAEAGLDLLSNHLKGNERARRSAIGTLLANTRKGQIFGGYKLEVLKKKVKHAKQFRLVNMKTIDGGESSDFDSPTPPSSNGKGSSYVYQAEGESGESNTPPFGADEKTAYTSDVNTSHTDSIVDFELSENEADFDSPDSPNGQNEPLESSGDAVLSEGESNSSRFTTDTPNGTFIQPDDSALEVYEPFINSWHTTYQNQMVYASPQLMEVAHRSGISLEHESFRPQTVLDSLLSEMTDKTLLGLTVRDVGGGAYQLEGEIDKEAPSPADEKATECVRQKLATHAELFRAGRAEDLSRYQIGSLRYEVNQKFGTHLVNDDIEGVWCELTGGEV